MGVRSRHIIRGIWRNSEGIPSSEEKTLGQRKATKRPKSCCKTGSVNHILNSSSLVLLQVLSLIILQESKPKENLEDYEKLAL